MSIPPALTWTHLLPADASLVPVRAPDWFRDLLQAPPRAARNPVLVSWNADAALSEPLETFAGLVTVNSDIPSRQLRAIGFPQIHRFAVVPSLDRARWFIPLDTPATTEGAWCLYTPLRRSASLKQTSVRLAARLRLPFWYRDVVSVALRGPAAVVRVAQQLFPDTPLTLGLSSGSPGPQLRRKAAAVALDARGRPLAFLKFSQSDVSRRLLMHEARVLTELEHMRSTARMAPRLLFAGDVDGSFVTVQTPIIGRPAGARITPAHRRFLDALTRDDSVVAAETALVTGLSEEVRDSGDPEFAAVFVRVHPVLQSLRIRSTVVHCDFVPWNVRRTRSALAAFDWDAAVTDGVPLYDELHYQLLTGYLLHGWSAAAARERLEQFAALPPPGLDAAGVRALATVYLLHYVLRLLRHGHAGDDPLVRWYRAVMVALHDGWDHGFPAPGRESELSRHGRS